MVPSVPTVTVPPVPGGCSAGSPSSYLPAPALPHPRLGLTAAGRPPSSATGKADEDGDEVADEMGEEEDKELRWKVSGICQARSRRRRR